MSRSSHSPAFSLEEQGLFPHLDGGLCLPSPWRDSPEGWICSEGPSFHTSQAHRKGYLPWPREERTGHPAALVLPGKSSGVPGETPLVSNS